MCLLRNIELEVHQQMATYGHVLICVYNNFRFPHNQFHAKIELPIRFVHLSHSASIQLAIRLTDL